MDFHPTIFSKHTDLNIKETISISQSPGKIWAFLVQVTTDAQWLEGITKAELTSEPPYGQGSTGIQYHKNLGAMPWTITRLEEGRLMEWVHRESKLAGTVASYQVEPENGGSRVTLQARMVVPFIMRIMMVLMKGRVSKGVKAELQTLKEIMEKKG